MRGGANTSMAWRGLTGEVGKVLPQRTSVTRAYRGLPTQACWGFPKVSTKRSKVLSFPLLQVGGWG